MICKYWLYVISFVYIVSLLSSAEGGLIYWRAEWRNDYLEQSTGMWGFEASGEGSQYWGMGLLAGKYDRLDYDETVLRIDSHLRYGFWFERPMVAGALGYFVSGSDRNLGDMDWMHGPLAGAEGRIPLNWYVRDPDSILNKLFIVYRVAFSPVVMSTLEEADSGTSVQYLLAAQYRHRKDTAILTLGVRHHEISGVSTALDEKLTGVYVEIAF